VAIQQKYWTLTSLEEEVSGIIRDGKAIVEVAAGQIPVNDLLYIGTEKSIFPFLSFLINLAPRRKIVRSLFLPSPERTGLADLLHGLAHLTGVLEHV